MRPQSIIRFEQFFLASVTTGVLSQVLSINYSTLVARFGADIFGAPAVVAGMLIGVAICWGMVMLFGYFVARRASNVAKWILVVMAVLGLLGMIRRLGSLSEYGTLFAVLTSLTTLLQLASIVFLFRRDAAEWLRSKGQTGAVDNSAFN